MRSMRLNAYHLPSELGAIFCTEYLPPNGRAPSFAVLALLPFAEENNKSRRMLMLQASAWTAIGGVTTLVDLSGTGDSLAEFRDATWEAWLEEAVLAWEHLRRRFSVPVWVWGVRAGALLALQLESERRIEPYRMVLWQPVVSGKTYLSQFLRLASAGRMLDASSRRNAVVSPRELLEAGKCAEVGGYELNPQLVTPMQKCALDAIVPHSKVLWLECGTSGELAQASMRTIAGWRAEGASVEAEAVVGPSFWASQEIETSEALVARTTALVSREIVEKADSGDSGLL